MRRNGQRRWWGHFCRHRGDNRVDYGYQWYKWHGIQFDQHRYDDRNNGDNWINYYGWLDEWRCYWTR